jgi:hypothetical protein
MVLKSILLLKLPSGYILEMMMLVHLRSAHDMVCILMTNFCSRWTESGVDMTSHDTS